MAATGTKNIRKVGILLTLLALVTAPFDALLVVEIGPMTLRMAQFFIVVASLLLLWIWLAGKKVSLPYGWLELGLLLQLNFFLCFVTQSESLLFQLGYQVWFVLDVALVVLCVNCFQTLEEKKCCRKPIY